MPQVGGTRSRSRSLPSSAKKLSPPHSHGTSKRPSRSGIATGAALSAQGSKLEMGGISLLLSAIVFGIAFFAIFWIVLGSLQGGLFLGLFESVGPILILGGLGIVAPYQLKDVIAFTMLVMILIFLPSGILGERLATKKA